MINVSQLILLFAFTGLTVSVTLAERRTVAAVIDDIDNLSSSTEKLDNAINNLPSEGILGVVPIEQDVTTIITLLQQTHSDIVSTGPISLSDASSVLAAVEKVEPVIIKTLSDFVAQKAEVQKLNEQLNGLTELAESDLEALASNLTAVESALISAAPAPLKPTASLISSSIGAALQTAIAAYAT